MVANFLKKNLKKIPIGISFGKLISCIPHQFRIGVSASYRNSVNEISIYNRYNHQERKNFIFTKFKLLLEHSYQKIPFYNQYYDELGFDIKTVKSFDDISTVPTINKKILKKYSLDNRASIMIGDIKSNTGGTSGAPLDFYTPSVALGHEIAHLESIWSRINYKRTDLRLIFVGQSKVRGIVEYDFLRHALFVDIYADQELVLKKLNLIVKFNKIKYIQGYPIAIYEFCKSLYKSKHRSYQSLFTNVEAVIYNSEFPQNHMREFIEKEVFEIDSLAFYGHTERCVLGYEYSNKYYNYKSCQTYGFSEIVNNTIVGTCYNNFSSPFIRYDTEDSVQEYKYKNGVLDTFVLTQGRKSDYIYDKKNKKISLTGLIFGRHHKLFDLCEYIQVEQIENGSAIIYYVFNNKINFFNAEMFFDNENLNIDLTFKEIGQPIKTKSGKTPLLIKRN